MQGLRNALMASAGLFLTGCENGTLVLSIADAPVDQATHVVVQVTEIELLKEGEDGKTFTFAPVRSVDLLQFSGGRSTILLDNVQVPEGDYSGLRMTINSDETDPLSYVDLVTGREPLFLPATNEALLTIDEPFTIERRKQLDLTIDFDLRQSVLPPESDGDPYELKPALRLIKDEDAAAITGSVSDALAGASGCSAAVYVFAGQDSEPNDVGSNADIVASERVDTGTVSSDFSYDVAFLPAGDYTVAFTCDAIDDNPRTDEADTVVSFGARTNVTVSAGETVTVNFQ